MSVLIPPPSPVKRLLPRDELVLKSEFTTVVCASFAQKMPPLLMPLLFRKVEPETVNELPLPPTLIVPPPSAPPFKGFELLLKTELFMVRLPELSIEGTLLWSKTMLLSVTKAP